jgi:hypothetical protein
MGIPFRDRVGWVSQDGAWRMAAGVLLKVLVRIKTKSLQKKFKNKYIKKLRRCSKSKKLELKQNKKTITDKEGMFIKCLDL